MSDIKTEYYPEIVSIKFSKIILVPAAKNKTKVQVVRQFDTDEMVTAGALSQEPDIFITSFVVNVVIKETQRDGRTVSIYRTLQREIVHEINAKILVNLVEPGSIMFKPGEEMLERMECSLEYFLFKNKVPPMRDELGRPIPQHIFEVLKAGEDENHGGVTAEPTLRLPYCAILEQLTIPSEGNNSANLQHS